MLKIQAHVWVPSTAKSGSQHHQRPIPTLWCPPPLDFEDLRVSGAQEGFTPHPPPSPTLAAAQGLQRWPSPRSSGTSGRSPEQPQARGTATGAREGPAPIPAGALLPAGGAWMKPPVPGLGPASLQSLQPPSSPGET